MTGSFTTRLVRHSPLHIAHDRGEVHLQIGSFVKAAAGGFSIPLGGLPFSIARIEATSGSIRALALAGTRVLLRDTRAEVVAP